MATRWTKTQIVAVSLFGLTFWLIHTGWIYPQFMPTWMDGLVPSMLFHNHVDHRMLGIWYPSFIIILWSIWLWEHHARYWAIHCLVTNKPRLEVWVTIIDPQYEYKTVETERRGIGDHMNPNHKWNNRSVCWFQKKTIGCGSRYPTHVHTFFSHRNLSGKHLMDCRYCNHSDKTARDGMEIINPQLPKLAKALGMITIVQPDSASSTFRRLITDLRQKTSSYLVGLSPL